MEEGVYMYLKGDGGARNKNNTTNACPSLASVLVSTVY